MADFIARENAVQNNVKNPRTRAVAQMANAHAREQKMVTDYRPTMPYNETDVTHPSYSGVGLTSQGGGGSGY